MHFSHILILITYILSLCLLFKKMQNYCITYGYNAITPPFPYKLCFSIQFPFHIKRPFMLYSLLFQIYFQCKPTQCTSIAICSFGSRWWGSWQKNSQHKRRDYTERESHQPCRVMWMEEGNMFCSNTAQHNHWMAVSNLQHLQHNLLQYMKNHQQTFPLDSGVSRRLWMKATNSVLCNH